MEQSMSEISCRQSHFNPNVLWLFQLNVGNEFTYELDSLTYPCNFIEQCPTVKLTPVTCWPAIHDLLWPAIHASLVRKCYFDKSRYFHCRRCLMSRRQIRYSTILWLLLFAVPRSFVAAEEMFGSEWRVSVASASRYSQVECPSVFPTLSQSGIIFRPWMHLSSLNDVWGHPSSGTSYSHYFLGTIFCTLFLIARAPSTEQ